jgi:plasmid stabilization system protein ParE
VKVIVTDEAASDLIEAIAYVNRDNPAAAQRLLARYDRAIERLAAGFTEGPEVLLRRRGKARRWSVRPYRIYYRREADAVVVLRFYHQSRRPIER